MSKSRCLPLLPLLAAASLFAQARFEFWPGAVYDPAIPTFRQVLGHDPAERIAWHSGLVKYMEALAQAAPRRMKIFDYGKTWEGRRLIYAAVGSEANIKRLEEIRAAMQRLADPRRTPEAEARKLMESLPAVIWLAYGVHGNEISSPEAALLTAYHLLAARNDKMVANILANVVVMIVPSQNPDGRDRFVHNFEQSEGLEPDPNPAAAEHMEPWPGGRSNHYYFDMNRDWFALTQPEIRSQARALLDWFPLVYVDLHEMGSDSTYYFAPEAVPYNPHLTRDQRAALEWFGKNNARWFDQFGFSYFTREVFDAFYPGYGASWPAYHGAVAMTYEQASARGLLMRRSDDTVFHFRETVRQHFTASLATCETAANQRARLLENFYRYRQTAIEEGQTEAVREFVLVRAGDTSAVDKLALLLAAQGVELKQAKAAFRAAGREFPAGSYVVPLAQPAKRLARTLLDAHVPMEDFFVKEQERRRSKKLPDEIYDVTAWSLPLQFNVECVPLGEAAQGGFEPVKAGPPPAGRVTGEAAVAYLVPWGTQAAGRFLAAALRQGLRVHSTDKAFKQGAREYPRGTLIVKVKENEPGVAEKVAKLAAASGAEVFGAQTGWVEEGPNFGSRHVVALRPPAIAILWDRPTSSASAGHARFVLERQYGYPATALRTHAVGMADLSKFHVIILPDGAAEGYASALGPVGVRKLKEWVGAGGTLIGIGGALPFLADPRTGLLAASQEDLARPEAETKSAPKEAPRAAATPAPPPAEAPPAAARVPGKILEKEDEYLKAIRPEREPPDPVAGVLVRARTDPDHWVTAGAADSVVALFAGRLIFAPMKLDKGVNAVLFEAADRLVAGGHMWAENRKQLAFKPLLMVQREGRGHVVAFLADPNFRAYLDGMNVLFLNAVFRGPARPRGLGGEE